MDDSDDVIRPSDDEIDNLASVALVLDYNCGDSNIDLCITETPLPKQGNCKPPLLAAHYPVRKGGPNKGRWFFTCQNPKGRRCEFFMWDNQAASRANSAVINNSRSEPAAAVGTIQAGDATTANKRTIEGYVEASKKRAADLVKGEEEGFGGWTPSVHDGTSFVNEENVVLGGENTGPATPRKTAKVEKFSTPGRKRRWDVAEGWPTPHTGRTNLDDVFTIPSATRLKGGMWDENERSGLKSPLITPTPTRLRGAQQPPEATSTLKDQMDYDITKEVMELLKGQSINDKKTLEIRQVLNRYAHETQGVIKGRDMTRMALKTKNGKIAELEQRILELQDERELDEVIVSHFKSDMAQLISKHGRGCGELK